MSRSWICTAGHGQRRWRECDREARAQSHSKRGELTEVAVASVYVHTSHHNPPRVATMAHLPISDAQRFDMSYILYLLPNTVSPFQAFSVACQDAAELSIRKSAQLVRAADVFVCTHRARAPRRFWQLKTEMTTFKQRVVLLSITALVSAQRIVLTNDDGWAVAQIRAEFEALDDVGYDVRSSLSTARKFATLGSK